MGRSVVAPMCGHAAMMVVTSVGDVILTTCFVRVAHGNEWTTRAKHVRKVAANAANVANLSSNATFLAR